MATQPLPPPILDHIVVLVSHATLLASPERLRDHLVVSPGGDHAGGLTSNKLILFRDGTYIELIAFREGVDGAARSAHRWGRCEENTVVDWAYTLPREADFGAVQDRVRNARAGVEYADPVPGGRTRPDGTVLRWAIGAARGSDGRDARPGSVPFWCLDRTPRGLRVPWESDAGATNHPAGVGGVWRLRVVEPEGEMEACCGVLDAVHGVVAGEERGWRFSVPAGQGMMGGAGEEGRGHMHRHRHTVFVCAASGDEGMGIGLALSGGGGSPSRIELVPGVAVDVESTDTE